MARRRASKCVPPNTSTPRFSPEELCLLTGDYVEIVLTFASEQTKLVAVGKIARVTDREVWLVDAHWHGEESVSRPMFLPLRWILGYSEFWK